MFNSTSVLPNSILYAIHRHYECIIDLIFSQSHKAKWSLKMFNICFFMSSGPEVTNHSFRVLFLACKLSKMLYMPVQPISVLITTNWILCGKYFMSQQRVPFALISF